MKKLKRLKKISGLLDEYLKELQNELDKVNKDYQKKVLESNYKLISEIAKGENLDEISLMEKYLKKSSVKSKLKKENEIKEINSSPNTEELLNHMNLDGNDYFFEDKQNGSVYNNKSVKVGEYNCGTIKLFNK